MVIRSLRCCDQSVFKADVLEKLETAEATYKAKSSSDIAAAKRDYELQLRQNKTEADAKIAQLEAKLGVSLDNIAFLEAQLDNMSEQVDEAGNRTVEVAQAKQTAAEVNIGKQSKLVFYCLYMGDSLIWIAHINIRYYEEVDIPGH